MEESGHCTLKDQIFYGGQDPDHSAIECPGCRPLTYRDLRLQIQYVTKSLNARGFHRNDRIAIITPAGPETAVCIVAVMAGFTSVPLKPQYKKQEFEEIFTRVGIKAIIVQNGCETDAVAVARSRGIPVISLKQSRTAGKFNLDPEVSVVATTPEFAAASDIAYILLTSGTTSVSKITSKTQKQSAIGKERICVQLNITGADRCLHITPYFHGMGIGSPLMGPLVAGATVICPRDFIPSDFIDLLMTFNPTYYTAGPALNQGILRELKRVAPEKLKNHSLRYINVGSGFLSEDLQRGLESLLGIPVIDSYGMSETGIIAVNIPPKRGSVGIPLPGILAIIDDTGTAVGPHCDGEIVIKDLSLFGGYEDGSEQGDISFINGCFRTGDIGYLDDEGYLFLRGRKKELINKGGEKISPEEIDKHLRSYPGVKDAMTFGIADPVLGEDVAALIVPSDQSMTEKDLRLFLLDRLVQFKIPRRIYVVDEIPRNAAGKPLRHEGTRLYGGQGQKPGG